MVHGVESEQLTGAPGWHPTCTLQRSMPLQNEPSAHWLSSLVNRHSPSTWSHAPTVHAMPSSHCASSIQGPPSASFGTTANSSSGESTEGAPASLGSAPASAAEAPPPNGLRTRSLTH